MNRRSYVFISSWLSGDTRNSMFRSAL